MPVRIKLDGPTKDGRLIKGSLIQERIYTIVLDDRRVEWMSIKFCIISWFFENIHNRNPWIYRM